MDNIAFLVHNMCYLYRTDLGKRVANILYQCCTRTCIMFNRWRGKRQVGAINWEQFIVWNGHSLSWQWQWDSLVLVVGSCITQAHILWTLIPLLVNSPQSGKIACMAIHSWQQHFWGEYLVLNWPEDFNTTFCTFSQSALYKYCNEMEFGKGVMLINSQSVLLLLYCS